MLSGTIEQWLIVTAAMGTVYEFTRCSAANLRRKDDTWNEAIGGFFGGAVVGLRCMLPQNVRAGSLPADSTNRPEYPRDCGLRSRPFDHSRDLSLHRPLDRWSP